MTQLHLQLVKVIFIANLPYNVNLIMVWTSAMEKYTMTIFASSGDECLKVSKPIIIYS